MGICRSLCHSFSFGDMRFAVEGYVFLYQILQEDLLQRKFVTEFCYFFFYFTFTYVPLDE